MAQELRRRAETQKSVREFKLSHPQIHSIEGKTARPKEAFVPYLRAYVLHVLFSKDDVRRPLARKGILYVLPYEHATERGIGDEQMTVSHGGAAGQI
jgi:hypothetical protein